MSKSHIAYRIMCSLGLVMTFDSCREPEIVPSGNDGDGQGTEEGAAGKPNLLFIMTDQHNAGVAGFAGHPDAITPNLDMMASEGLVYSRAYCADGISSASRMALFKGITQGQQDSLTMPMSRKSPLFWPRQYLCSSISRITGTRHMLSGKGIWPAMPISDGMSIKAIWQQKVRVTITCCG